MKINHIYNEDCQEGIKRIPDASVDCILTDPPYLYLKGQKLEREFDERSLFAEFKRVLKPTGFVVLFGRGTSFYRWNMILCDLGFEFKEEIIWNKSYCSSPLMALSRVHETVSIHSMKGVINKVKIPYLEMKSHDISAIKTDINRLLTTYSNPTSLVAVKKYLESGELTFDGEYKAGVTITSGRKRVNRCVSTIKTIQEGMNEKDIIRIRRDHYNQIHPTQKPVRLLERLLALTTNPGDVVLDTFAGSCNTAVACINSNLHYICYEIDKEYYDDGCDNVKKRLSEPKLAM